MGDSVGLGTGDAVAAFSNQAPLPSVADNGGRCRCHSRITTSLGNELHFTVGHGPQHNRQVTNGIGPDDGATSTSFVMADLFGGELLLPDGELIRHGMTFSGTHHRRRHQRILQNKNGAGYSKTDGFGFINAEAAVHLRPR